MSGSADRPPRRERITETWRKGRPTSVPTPGDWQPTHAWYLEEDGRLVGPWTPWDLWFTWRDGKLPDQSLVRRQDMSRSIPLRDIWELIDETDRVRIDKLRRRHGTTDSGEQDLLPSTD